LSLSIRAGTLAAFDDSMLFGVMLMDLGDAGPVYQPPPAVSSAREEKPGWFFRGSAGLGTVAPSAQRDLLELNGYDNPGLRWHLTADAAGFPWRRVGIGGFVGYSFREVEPRSGGPPLEEEIYRLGAEVPLVFGTDRVRFLLVPRLGLATGRQSLHGRGDFVVGPLLGVDAGVVFPKVHMGLALGGYTAPVRASGDLGEREDLGGVELLFSVYFDG
jgi:hypothetical protein